MKSALPPLKPTRTSQEISNFHFTDLSYKLGLIDKARITVTTIELNDIISELQHIYLNDTDAFKTFRKTLDIKRNQLKDDSSRFKSLEKSYQTLKSNTSIIRNLESSNISVKIEELIKSINEIDVERQMQHPPPMAVDPQTVIRKKESDVLKFLHLKELNFREIESLIYLLKKRALSVDKSDESIGGIHKEFGSVSKLIEYAEKLEKENAKLKNIEMKYIQDTMTKRRPFTHLSTLGNQSIILILQSAMNSLFQYSKELNCPLSKEEGQNFESVCSDPSFRVEKISFETESNDQTSVSIDEALSIAKTQYEKLDSSEVLKCRLLPPDFPEAPTSQLDKLLKSNDEHLEAMRAKQISIHKNQLEIVELTRQILEILSEKRRLEHISAKIFTNLKDLNDCQISLIENQMYNRNTVDALNNIVSAVGMSLVSSQPNQILKDAVINHLIMLTHTADNSVNNNNNNNKKKKKKDILQQTSAFDLKPKKNLNPKLEVLKNAKNDQLFSGLEMAINISDLDKESIETHFIRDLRSNIQTLKTDFSKAMNEMSEFLSEKILTLKSADGNILRKTYFNKEIQAKLSVKGDQICQTDESKVKKK